MNDRIPTALTHPERSVLTFLATDQIVYEAGALLGASTIALAQMAKFVVSINPHDGYPRRDPSPTWSIFCRNLHEAGVSDRVQPIRARFQDVPPRGVKYGLAFADLTGDYHITRQFLLDTAHIKRVAIHDYARTGCEGATRAIDEYIKTQSGLYVSRVDTLIMLERR